MPCQVHGGARIRSFVIRIASPVDIPHACEQRRPARGDPSGEIIDKTGPGGPGITGYGLFGAQTVRAMCAHSSPVHSE
eukprot:759106-Prymnesium_polylepis.1